MNELKYIRNTLATVVLSLVSVSQPPKDQASIPVKTKRSFHQVTTLVRRNHVRRLLLILKVQARINEDTSALRDPEVP